jgi:RNAse (barnase) inhibitor barstar
MTRYVIDGNSFSTLEGFFDVVGSTMLGSTTWGRNLDAFNDILRGGFGTPESGFTIVWRNANVSRERLGYAETVRQLKLMLARCHPTNRSSIADQIAAAEAQTGPTVFDWVLEIIRDHGPGGSEADDNVVIELAK